MWEKYCLFVSIALDDRWLTKGDVILQLFIFPNFGIVKRHGCSVPLCDEARLKSWTLCTLPSLMFFYPGTAILRAHEVAGNSLELSATK